GFNADVQVAAPLPGIARNDLNLPCRLAVTVGGSAFDAAGAHVLPEVHADVVICDLAGLICGNRERALATFKYGLHLLDNVVRLERLAVIFKDVVVNGVAGFGAQVAGKLSSGVQLHTDSALAITQNGSGLATVERQQIFEVQLIRDDAECRELRDG